MSNQGPHTNASQFFVTLKPLPFLDTKFQAIGRVVTGMRHFRGIEKMRMANQRPQGTCLISAARVLAEDGWILAACNLGEVSPRQFDGFVDKGGACCQDV